MKKIVIPEGMLKAAYEPFEEEYEFSWTEMYTRKTLEAALRWLSENPIIPTDQKACELLDAYGHRGYTFGQWQRRMFDSVPEMCPVNETAQSL
jgi:hypothetical protein